MINIGNLTIFLALTLHSSLVFADNIAATPSWLSPQYYSGSSNEPATRVFDECRIKISNETLIYAAGSRKGSPVSGTRNGGSEFDIVVNSPGDNVALLLSTMNYSKWNVAWTKDTVIDSVYIVSGSNILVEGLPDNVKIFHTGTMNEACNSEVRMIDSKAMRVGFDTLSLFVFGRPTNKAYNIHNGVAIMGKPLVSNDKVYTYVK